MRSTALSRALLATSLVTTALLSSVVMGQDITDVEPVTDTSDSHGLDGKLLDQSIREQGLRVTKLNAIRQAYDGLRRMHADLEPQPRPSKYAIVDELERDPRYYGLSLKIDELRNEVERMSGFVRPNSAQITELQQEIARLDKKRSILRKELEPRVTARLKALDQDQRRLIEIERMILAALSEQLNNAKQSYKSKLEEVQRHGAIQAQREQAFSLRSHHIRAAAKHLRQAGLHELVAQLEPIQPPKSPVFPRSSSQNDLEVSELRHETKELRQQIEEIRKLLGERATHDRAE